MKPLDGIRVLDFSTLLPGPLATLMLVDAGAEVIKVEKVGGEDLRKSKPFFKGNSLLFSILNRGKKSVEIDLKIKKNSIVAKQLYNFHMKSNSCLIINILLNIFLLFKNQ